MSRGTPCRDRNLKVFFKKSHINFFAFNFIVHFMQKKDVMEIYRQIGEKIRKLRLTKGLSQKDLAKHVGVTYQQIQNYEKGKSKIPVDRLIKIAETLEVSLDYFLKEFDNNHDKVPESELALLNTYYKSIQSETIRRQILNLLKSLSEGCS